MSQRATSIIYFWTLFLVAVIFLGFVEATFFVLVATASANQTKNDQTFYEIK